MENQQIGRLGGEASSANRLAWCYNCDTNKDKDKVLLKEQGDTEKEIIDEQKKCFESFHTKKMWIL